MIERYNVDDLPDEVSVQRCQPPCWRLVDIGIDKESGLHHIYFVEPRSSEVSGLISWADESDTVSLDQKPPTEPAGNFPMWPENMYTAQLTEPSDVISGLHLPQNQHWSYYLSFAWIEPEPEIPTPVPEPEPEIPGWVFDYLRDIRSTAETILAQTDEILYATDQLIDWVIPKGEDS